MKLILNDVPLHNKNTFRIGGKAKLFAQPSSETQLLELLNYSGEKDIPVLILGRGSNILVSDSGWDGLVINISENFSRLEWTGSEVQCMSGACLDKLIMESIRRGFSGMEELSGIPGTIGGAVTMNAGAFSSCIADTIISARYINPATQLVHECPAGELELGYRTSKIKRDGSILVSAEFSFSLSDPEKLHSKRMEILKRRKGKQPLEFPNCGSVFKRPRGNYAGTLIEKCSLKGYRCGDVEVSAKHANFIVNRGNGSANEVLCVINHVRKTVYQQHGILLEPEVVFAGEFDQPLYVPED
ncbi:UDP-N-acetylenolpyruvoylglucosamine reductase [Chitinispirillum alkaliphilum]|nr:UDP-N-acetylenolpyruvoylglucosamine reductase [Chitinispirillum alkaliphilum]